MNELEMHTRRRMEDTPDFFMWVNGDFKETLVDYYIHLKMIEAERLYGN